MARPGSGLAAVFALAAPAPPANAAEPKPVPSLADQITALAKGGADWRTTIKAKLAAAPELRGTRSVAASTSGQILAGTVRLPATLRLSGDATIVASHIVLTGNRLRVIGGGHTLRLFPISTIGSGQADVATPQA